MHRIVILSLSSPGHFYPLTALGRRLQSLGPRRGLFSESPTSSGRSGLRAWAPATDRPGRTSPRLDPERAMKELGQLKGLAALRCGLGGICRKAKMLFRDAPSRSAMRKSIIPRRPDRDGWWDRRRIPGPAVRQRGGRPANQPRRQRPTRDIPWSQGDGVGARLRNGGGERGPASGSSREFCGRSTAVPPGVGALPLRGNVDALFLRCRRSRRCRPPWNCRVAERRPACTTPAPGLTRPGAAAGGLPLVPA